MSNKTRALAYTLFCVALWALIPVVSKLGQDGLDNHQFLFWSSLVSFVAFAVASAERGKISALRAYRAKDWLSMIALGFLGTYLYYVLLYFGYAKAEGFEVLVLQYTWPIFIVLLSVPFLRERFTPRRVVACALGFSAVVLVLTKGDLSGIKLGNFAVDAYVLIGAFSFALFSVLGKKVSFEPFTMNAVFFFIATIVSFASMMVFSGFAAPSARTALPVLVNGLFVNGLSYVLWIKALRAADASFVAPFVFLTPVIAAIYLVVFFSAPVVPVYGIALVFVVVAGFVNRK
jgi:drug/metabolite transporter (DMT)-like permease